MKRLPCVIALTFVLSVSIAGPASARYYLTRTQAIHFARDWVHYKLGYHGSSAYCRPQGRNDVEPGYIYHSWLCAWRGYSDSGNIMCRGLVIVKGSSSSRGSYYTHRMQSGGDCPY